MKPEIVQFLRQARILNWTYFAHIEQFIRANVEDFENLYNDRYWRAKMTPEDIEMRRHPNRSYDWIPGYLRDQRRELQMKLLDYLVGPENYEKGSWSRAEACYGCKVLQVDRNNFMKDMTKCLESKSTESPPSHFFVGMSNPEYEKIRSECFEQTSAKYEPKVSRSIAETRWQAGSVPFSASLNYGYCPYCWDDIEEQSQALIRRFK